MNKLLLIGIDTRSIVNSALNLDYEVFSTSYFKTSDFPDIKHSRCILKEEENTSCGLFKDKFNPKNLLEESSDYLKEVDYIIPLSGINANDFTGKFKKFKSKILGNKDTKSIDDKFKFYKKIRNKFLTPETFKVNDIDEAIEILKNNEKTRYIVKPISGSGGYDINLLDTNSLNQLDCEFLVQEYIEGVNVSSSVIGNGKDAKNIINSRLLTAHDFGENSYLYVGNILPLTEKSILSKKDININKLNEEMCELSEELIKLFKLVGSNGVDFIAKGNNIYTIEINPRIQGTYECCENVLSKNLLAIHIDACLGNLIDSVEINGYSYKKILYAQKQNKYSKLNLNNIYDLPHIGSITEKGEPLLTIVDSDNDFENLLKKVDSTSLEVESKLNNPN